jgi:hypothetical protein
MREAPAQDSARECETKTNRFGGFHFDWGGLISAGTRLVKTDSDISGTDCHGRTHSPSSGAFSLLTLLVCCLFGFLSAEVFGASPEHPVSFRNDVMAILSKAGCNAGACHGNANGKAGFKLSLRGEVPISIFSR